MTIRVLILNDDIRESAVIIVEPQNLDGTPVSGMIAGELKGGPDGTGESVQMYVHSGQQLVIKEFRQE